MTTPGGGSGARSRWAGLADHLFLVYAVAFQLLAPLALGSELGLTLQRRATALLLVLGLTLLRRSRRDLIVGLALLVPAVVLDNTAPDLRSAANIASLALGILYLAHVGRLLLLGVFRRPVVDVGAISAALSVYVVLGFIWSLAYDLLDCLQPAAAIQGIQSAGEVANLAEHMARRLDLNYFSMVTLTTLGYGDLVPLTPLARALASLEAFFGQVFLAVLVARLVGSYASRPSP